MRKPTEGGACRAWRKFAHQKSLTAGTLQACTSPRTNEINFGAHKISDGMASRTAATATSEPDCGGLEMKDDIVIYGA